MAGGGAPARGRGEARQRRVARPHGRLLQARPACSYMKSIHTLLLLACLYTKRAFLVYAWCASFGAGGLPVHVHVTRLTHVPAAC